MPEQSRRGQDPKADDFLFLLERSAKRILRASNDRRTKEAKRSRQIAKGLRPIDSPNNKREEKESFSLNRTGKRGSSTTAKVNPLIHSPISSSAKATKESHASSRQRQPERWANPRTALAGLSLTSKPPRLPQLTHQLNQASTPETANNANNPNSNAQISKMTQQLRSLEQVYSTTASEQIKPRLSLRPVRFAVGGDQGAAGNAKVSFENETAVDLATMLRRAARVVAPGSLATRPEHTAPRRLSVTLWTDPSRKVPMERGMGDLTMQLAKLHENELQGPTNWTHVDLRVKYRDESSRTSAYQATQSLMDTSDKVESYSPVLVAQHPCHTDFYELVRQENSQFSRQVNARNSLRRFQIDMEIIWTVNRPGHSHRRGELDNPKEGDPVSELSYPHPPTPEDLMSVSNAHAQGGPRGLPNRRDPDAHQQSEVQVQSVSTECALAGAIRADVSVTSRSSTSSDGTSVSSSSSNSTPRDGKSVERLRSLGPVWCTVSAPVYDRGEQHLATSGAPGYDEESTRIAVVSVHSPTPTRPDAFALRAYDTASSTHCTWTVTYEAVVRALLQYARSTSGAVLLRSAMYKSNSDHPERLASAHLVRTSGLASNTDEARACQHTLCQPPILEEEESDMLDDGPSTPLVARFVLRASHPESLSRTVLCCKAFVDLERDRLVYHVGRWRSTGVAEVCVHVPLQIAREHNLLLGDPDHWEQDDIELLRGARHIASHHSWTHAVFAALALSVGGVNVAWPLSLSELLPLQQVPLRLLRRFLRDSLALSEDQGGLGLQETARKYRFMKSESTKSLTLSSQFDDNDATDSDAGYSGDPHSTALVIDKEQQQLRVLQTASASATTPITLTLERAYLEGAISASGLMNPSSIAWGRGVPGWSLLGRRATVLACFFRGVRSNITRPILQTLSQSLDNALLGPILLAFTSDTTVGVAEPFENSTGFVPATVGPFFHAEVVTQAELELPRVIMALNSCVTFEDVGGMKPELYSGHRRHDAQVDERNFRSVVMVDRSLLTQPNAVIPPAAFGVTNSAAVPAVPDTWPFRYTWHSEDTVTAELIRKRGAKDFASMNYRLATIGSNDPMLYNQRMSGHECGTLATKSRSRFDVEEKLREEQREREALVRRARAKVEVHRQAQEKAMKEREWLRFELKEKDRQARLRAGRAARFNRTLGARTEDWLERTKDKNTKLAGRWGVWQAYWFIDEDAQKLLERHREDADKLQLALVAMGEDMKSAEEVVEEEQRFYIREATLMYHNKEENVFSWDQPRGWEGIAAVIGDDAGRPGSTNTRVGTGQSNTESAGGEEEGGGLNRDSYSRQKELGEREEAMKEAQDEEQRSKTRIAMVESALAHADMVEHARMVRTIEIDVAGWLDAHAVESDFDRESGQASAAFDLRMYFRDIDSDDTALVNHEEFKLVLAQMGFNFTQECLDAILRDQDPKGLGLVDYYEFVNWLINIPCKSSDAWFALSSECKEMPPHAWESMRQNDKMVDCVVEWEMYRDMAGTRETYYFSTATGEYSWRRPERVAVLLRLRRDAVELSQAQSAASLAAEAAVECSEHAERAADRSVDRLVSALSGSQAFVELLASQLGLTPASRARTREEEEEDMAFARAQAGQGDQDFSDSDSQQDADSAWTENDLSSSGDEEFEDAYGVVVNADQDGRSEGVVNVINGYAHQPSRGSDRSGDSDAANEAAAQQRTHDDVHGTNEEGDDGGCVADDERDNNSCETGPRWSESAPTAAAAVEDSVRSSPNTKQRKSVSQPDQLTRSAGRNSVTASRTRRRSSRGESRGVDGAPGSAQNRRVSRHEQRHRVSRGAKPQVRDLAATLHREIARMRRHTMAEKQAAEDHGFDMKVDADVALDKPGMEWRLLRPSATKKGFVTKASEPQTMGLKHGLVTSNKPSLVGVVDAAEVSHFSFTDFPVINVMLLGNINKELDKMAETGSAGAMKDAILGIGAPNEKHDALEMVHECFVAVKNARMDVIEKCFEEGVQVGEVDEHGNTMLHIAAQQGLKRISKFLLRKGANINAQNLAGNTVLHYCFEYKLNELAEYFIAKGADDSLLNAEGLTCYEGLHKENVDAI